MTESEADATRERILRVATAQFAARGYHATSLRELAELADISKAAVLYHFPSKDAILAALAEPLLRAIERVATRATAAPREAAAQLIIEGMLDAWLDHRYLLQLNLQDLAMASVGAVFERFRAAMLRANQILAGPKPSMLSKVRAAQALAMLGDPVVLYADEPPALLRSCVLDGVQRLLGSQLSPARARRRGRPSRVNARMAESARRMQAAGKSAEEIAAKLGISRATVYRHLN